MILNLTNNIDLCNYDNLLARRLCWITWIDKIQVSFEVGVSKFTEEIDYSRITKVIAYCYTEGCEEYVKQELKKEQLDKVWEVIDPTETERLDKMSYQEFEKCEKELPEYDLY